MYELVEKKYPKLKFGLGGNIISPEEQKNLDMTPEQKKQHARVHWYKLVEASVEEESRKWLQKELEAMSSLRYYAMFKKDIVMEQYLRDSNRVGIDVKLRLRAGTYRLASYELKTNPFNSTGHCTCCSDGVIETRAHFLLHCPAYKEIRLNLIHSINTKFSAREHGLQMTTSFKKWMSIIKFECAQLYTQQSGEQKEEENKTENLQICFILNATPPAEIINELNTKTGSEAHQHNNDEEDTLDSSTTPAPRPQQCFTQIVEKATRKFLQLIDRKRTEIVAVHKTSGRHTTT
jgi:hypothetical protein